MRDSESDINVLTQMTWLERLWFSNNMYDDAQVARLREALPNTQIEIIYDMNCVSKGWREGSKAYFDMRDALHMYYMDDDSNDIPINPYTGEENKYQDTNPFL